MSDGAHLLIPFAWCTAPGAREALEALALPNLRRLLGRLAAAGRDVGDAASLSPPHERAWALHHGFVTDDGLVPLAAWEARDMDIDRHAAGAWAWITPCHWRVGSDHVALTHVADLRLTPAEDEALLALVQPYFTEDGITLHARRPGHWLARGELFRGLPTASLDRAAGRVLDRWMPRDEAARPLRRLQQEFQMLLYTAPFNDDRQQRGLPPVNSFWASGTGDLPAQAQNAQPLLMPDVLRPAALRDDAAAWAEAWQALDGTDVAHVLAMAERGAPVRLTLCGEQGWRAFASEGAGALARLARWLKPMAPIAVLEGL